MGLPAVRHGLIVSAVAGAAVLAAAGASAQASSPGRHVKASLVAETDAVVPGRRLSLGIRLQMDPGWHTYWSNPGDSGLPTKARLTLPEGFAAGELQWPAPERFATGPIVSYGYSGEVLLPIEVRVPATVRGAEVRLLARVDWLECQEACLPGRADVALALPVRAAAKPGPAAPLFAGTRRLLPSAPAGWTIAASAGGAELALSVGPPAGEEFERAHFYPLAPRVLDHSGPQTLERVPAGRYRLRLVRDPNGVAVERLAGVLVVETPGGRRALRVDAPLPPAAPAQTSGS
jgi:thiol:disulfide interchange protein DsbD